MLAGEAQVLPAPVQPALVAVYHHPAGHAPPPLQPSQHLPDHLPRVAPGYAVGQDHVVVEVHYRGQVQTPAAEDTHLRHVRHQLLQRGGGSELPAQQVGRVSGGASASPAALAAVGAHQTHGAHATVHRLEVHVHPAALQRGRHLPAAVLPAAAREGLRYQRVLRAPGLPAAQRPRPVVVRAAAHPRHPQQQLQRILPAKGGHRRHRLRPDRRSGRLTGLPSSSSFFFRYAFSQRRYSFSARAASSARSNSVSVDAFLFLSDMSVSVSFGPRPDNSRSLRSSSPEWYAYSSSLYFSRVQPWRAQPSCKDSDSVLSSNSSARYVRTFRSVCAFRYDSAADRIFLHHSCAYVDVLWLTPCSLPFSACDPCPTPPAGAHSKCSPFSSLLLSLSNFFGTAQCSQIGSIFHTEWPLKHPRVGLMWKVFCRKGQLSGTCKACRVCPAKSSAGYHAKIAIFAVLKLMRLCSLNLWYIGMPTR